MNVVKFNEVGGVLDGAGICWIKLRKFLGSYDRVFNAITSFHDSGFFRVPSIYESGMDAVCVSSFFSDHINLFGVANYLKFHDHGRVFYILQHHNFFSGLIIPSAGVALVASSIFLERGGRIKQDLDKYGAEEEGGSGLRFLGFVNGYPRPYHYFYDRLPYALFFRDRFPEIPFFDLKKMDFLSFGGEGVDVGELNSYSLERRGVFIVPSKIGPRFDHMNASVMVRDNFSVAVGKDGFSNNFVAWIGLCSEKRAWPERESSVIRIIEYILSVKSDVVFVFDGMTSSESDDVDVFREKHCSSEIDNMSFVISALGCEIDYVDLIGAKAKDKILASMDVDVFFTSALTDSMWPAHFGRAKGLAYCARVANYSIHDHPNTRFIDSAFINDLDDGVANWARKGFSISVDDAFMSFKNFFDEEFLGR